MGRIEKLLNKAKENPVGLAFAEFETLLDRLGWVLARQRGSHRLWRSPGGQRLPIQPDGNTAKAYQVRQFLKIQEEESDEQASNRSV